ncbi:mitogen-activated protein kinase kinase kinase 20-like [Lineus longissimus]|uniref:mitogen-activated protein kinase kinase kinase 20-like n=1 Tax=Lineus longissimus TaxID=88925 RepID=UPI00315CCAAE
MMAKVQKPPSLLDYKDFSPGTKLLPSLPVDEKTTTYRFVRTHTRPPGASFSDPIRSDASTLSLPKIQNGKFRFRSEQDLSLVKAASLVVDKSDQTATVVQKALKSQTSENLELGDDLGESVDLPHETKHTAPAHLPKKLYRVVDWKETIGYGTFGDVYRAYWHEGQKDIAIKIVKLSRDSDLENYKREIKIWRDLRHTLLLRLYKYYLHTPTATVYMFMELAKHGSLYDHIERTRKDGNTIELHDVINWASDILQALSYLHDRNIAHRDLKSPNVVLCDSHVRKNLRAKVCDFGTSRIIDHTTQATGMIGSTRWMAPEIMRGEKYNVKCDIYSFGVLLWEMLTSQVPFQNKTNPYALMWSVLELDERPPMPDMADWTVTRRYLMTHVVEACWVGNTDKRPSAKKLTDKLLQYKDM